MCNYAANDCAAIYQIIVSTKILDEQHLSSEHSFEISPMDQTIFLSNNDNDNNDDDTHLFEITSTNRIITIDRCSTEEQLKLTDRTPQKTSITIAPKHVEPLGLLSKEDRHRIHNRSCTRKQRRRAYQHELIFRNIDRRFSITKIKKILLENDIKPTALNKFTSKSGKTSLFVGIKDEELLEQYEEKLRHGFTTRYYHQWRMNYQSNRRKDHRDNRHRRF